MSPEPRSPQRLPVLELVGRLGRSLAEGRSAILTAPPGTGKKPGPDVGLALLAAVSHTLSGAVSLTLLVVVCCG